MVDEHAPRRTIYLLLFCALVLFAANLGGYDLWPADEPRFAQVSREMLHSGDYLAPHVNGEPYREKPPLLFWAIALVSQPMDEVNAWTARIPSAAAALVTLLFTWLLAKRMYGTQTAFWSVVVLATCTRFWWQARTVQIDMLLTACLAAALYLFWRWHEDRQTRHLAAFYAAIALAVYAKGPPGLVFPLLLIFVFYWKQPEDRRKTHWVIGNLAVIAAIALWLIPARMAVSGEGVTGAQSAIGADMFRQTIGRFFLGVSKAEWPWYYLVNLPVDLLPWTLFLPYAVIYVWKRRHEGPPMRYLLAWTIPAFIFFSICIGKRAIYLLPIYPALAILMARAIIDLMESPREAWRKRTAWAWAGFLVIAAVVPFAVPFTEYAEAWRLHFLILTILAAAMAVHAVYLVARTNANALHWTVAAHVAVLQLTVAFIAFPAIDPYKSAREFCEPMRALNAAGSDYELYSMGFSREAYIFYAERFHTPLVYGLLDITLPEDADQSIDPVQLQVTTRRALARATREVGVESFSYMPSKTRAALQQIIQQTIDESDAGPKVVETFIDALRQNTAPLAGDRPILVMVQQQDYKWLLPLLPVLENYRVLNYTSIGSRDMLLLANPHAIEALEMAGVHI